MSMAKKATGLLSGYNKLNIKILNGMTVFSTASAFITLSTSVQ